MNGVFPQHALQRIITLGLVAWVAVNSVQAKAEKFKFLETVGTSTAIGTVLGASTLPFYEHPKEHFGNVFIGAAAGAVAGFGLWVYGKITRTSEEEKYYFSDNRLQPDRVGRVDRADYPHRNNQAIFHVSNTINQPSSAKGRASLKPLWAMWVPLVSLNWK